MHSRRKADSVKCVCVCEDRGNKEAICELS